MARAHYPDAERSAPPIVKATAHQGRAVNLRVAYALVVLCYMCSCPMVGTSQQGDRWLLELTVDSAIMSKTRAGAELIVVL